MATLTEINVTLESMRDEQKETTSAVHSLTAKISAQMEASEMNRLKALNPSVRSPSTPMPGQPATPAGAVTPRDGFMGGKAAGLGLGMSMMGSGLLKGAGGIAAMGAAIPAFFGGLLAGSEGLSWLQDVQGMDFQGLKKAALGFSDIILDMDPKAFAVLGGIMAVSAVGGKKAAMGVGVMGLAISGFLGGLLAGSAALGVADWMGADFEFTSLKKAMVGFSDMIIGVDPKALAVFAGILGLGALGGLKGKNPLVYAQGMAAMSAGIVGFLGGLAIGNTLLEGADWLGADLNYAALTTSLAGFSSMVGALSEPAVISLGVLLGSSAVLAKFGAGPKTAANTVAMMTGLGAGISGLMIGLAAGDAGIGWIKKASGIESGGLVSMFKVFNDSISELKNENAIKALGAIVAVGTAAGLVMSAGGLAAGVGIFGVMTGIGAGIAGLMLGLAAGDVGISWIQQFSGSGDGIKGIFKTFNDSILAITPEAIGRIKNLMDLGGLDIAGALTGLTAGIAAFLGAGGISSTFDKLGDAFWGGFDAIFGTKLKDKKQPSIVEQMIEGLRPLDDFNTSKLDSFSEAMNRFTGSFDGLGEIDSTKSTKNLVKMIGDMGGVIRLLDPLINGGEFDPNKGSFKGFMQGVFGNDKEILQFGGGLKSLDTAKLEDLSVGVNALRSALGVNSQLSSTTEDTVTKIARSEVSIVKISDEVLSALTVALMQSDYQERVAAPAGGGNTYAEGDTINQVSPQGIIMPAPDNYDRWDGRHATRSRRGGPF